MLLCRKTARSSELSPRKESHQVLGSEVLPMLNHTMLEIYEEYSPAKHEKAHQ